MSARTPKLNPSLPTVDRADDRKPQPSSFCPVVLMEPKISQYQVYETFLSHSSGVLGKNSNVQGTQVSWEEPSCLELTKNHVSWALVSKHIGVWVMTLDP